MIIRCHGCNADPPAARNRRRQSFSMTLTEKMAANEMTPTKSTPAATIIGEAGKRDSRAREGPRVEEGRAAMNAALERLPSRIGARSVWLTTTAFVASTCRTSSSLGRSTCRDRSCGCVS